MIINSHPWFDPEALVGISVGGYQLHRLAGSGGFGVVYVTESQDAVPLALKLLYPPFSNAPDDLERWSLRATHFLREVQTAARFRQPNIIRVYDTGQFLWHFADASAGVSGGGHSGDYLLPYYVADHFPDGLEQRGGGSFKPDAAARIAQGICDGLAALHDAEPKVLHLDLNPGNIRLGADGRPVITDFGVARTEVPRPSEVTGPPPVYPGVAAPEQYAGEVPDERTDIYQLGSLLCWMLVGHYPNMGGIPELIARKDIDLHLKQTVLRCVEASRERRFQDVAALKFALATEPSMWERARRSAANSIPTWWRSATLAAGLLLAVLAAVWLVGLLPPPRPVEITIASSSTKQEWLAEVIGLFNDESKRERSLQLRRNSLQIFGRPIEVTVVKEEIEPGVFNEGWRSGTMVRDLLDGKIKPTIASPADVTWVEKIARDWPGSDAYRSSGGGPSVIGADAEDLLRTPLVLAMWESRARALDCWPQAKPRCTWKAIVELASDPRGWASLGHPEWGRLKFGYAIVGGSNSATFTAMLVCLTGLEDPNAATPDDVRASNGCGQAISDLEKAEIVSDLRSSRILRAMREQPPGYLDAVPTYEAEVVEINLVWGKVLPEPLVSVYPQDGTTASTHPFAVLDGAPWVSTEQADAARIFRKFLLEPTQQALLVRRGLRPIIRGIPLGPPIDHSLGADSAATLVFPEITQEMLDRIVGVWEAVISTSR